MRAGAAASERPVGRRARAAAWAPHCRLPGPIRPYFTHLLCRQVGWEQETEGGRERWAAAAAAPSSWALGGPLGRVAARCGRGEPASWPAGRRGGRQRRRSGRWGQTLSERGARQGHRLCSPSQDPTTEGRTGLNCWLRHHMLHMAHAAASDEPPPPPPPPPLALALGGSQPTPVLPS